MMKWLPMPEMRHISTSNFEKHENYGVIHVAPDWDALGFAFLAWKAFGLTRWKFVTQNTPDAEILASATLVGDVGQSFDCPLLRFDHHQMDWVMQKDVSATSLFFDYLLSRQCEVGHLLPLVQLITDADTGKDTPETKYSILMGMHADLRDFKLEWKEATNFYPSDDVTVNWAIGYLMKKDRILKREWDLGDRMMNCIEREIRGTLCLLADGDAAITSKALQHYPLVLFVNSDMNMIGIQRQKNSSISCHAIVQRALRACDEALEEWEYPDIRAIREELQTWFNHKSGFFSGRGTGGAPSNVPIIIDRNMLFKFIYDALQEPF